MENFDAVYAAHFRAVYRFLLGLCRSAPLAEELCQETFVQAMVHWRDFRGDCAVETWLCAIAKRLYFSRCRREHARALPQYSPDAQPAPRNCCSPGRGKPGSTACCIRSPNPTGKSSPCGCSQSWTFASWGSCSTSPTPGRG